MRQSYAILGLFVILFCVPHAQARPNHSHHRLSHETQVEAQQEPVSPKNAPHLSTPTAPVSSAAEANAPTEATQTEPSLLGDTPPPSTYDRMVSLSGNSNFTSENSSMVGQLLRTLAALVGVLALIGFGAKLLLPRVNRGKFNRSSSLEVLERLNLDGRNTLVVVGTKKGGRLLLGCSEHGVSLLERTPAGGAYASGADGILRPSPGLTTFGDHLAPDSDIDGGSQEGQT